MKENKCEVTRQEFDDLKNKINNIALNKKQSGDINDKNI